MRAGLKRKIIPQSQNLICAAEASLSADIAKHPTATQKNFERISCPDHRNSDGEDFAAIAVSITFHHPQDHQKRRCPHALLRRARSDQKDHEFR